MTVYQIGLIAALFVGVVAFLVLLIFIQKRENRLNVKRQSQARDYLFHHYFDDQEMPLPVSEKFFFDAYIDIETQVAIEPNVREKVIQDLRQTKFCEKQIHHLNHPNPHYRKLAVFYLGALKTPETKSLLEQRITKEKDESVLFSLFYALIEFPSESLVQLLGNSLIGASQIYREWIHAIVRNYYPALKPYLASICKDCRDEVREMILYLVANHPDAPLRDYAWSLVVDETQAGPIRIKALLALAKTHPQDLIDRGYLTTSNEEYQRIAILASGNLSSDAMLTAILKSVDGGKLDVDRTQAISRMIFDDQSLLLDLVDYFTIHANDHQKEVIARVLSHRIDYLLNKSQPDEWRVIKPIIELILKLHIVEDFMDFMNSNKNKEIEKRIVPLITKYAAQDNYLLNQFSIYFNQDLLIKLAILKRNEPSELRGKPAQEKSKVTFILLWVALAFFVPLSSYIIINIGPLLRGELDFLTGLVIHLNNFLALYFIVVNSIYLTLMLVSLRAAQEREEMWATKKQTLLFEKGVLPSISIIAPAYNEEKSIIDSVTSLLNLKYPQYEVIVVNDGSKDKTLQVLIDHFKLERKHPFFKLPIRTKPLRGVYVTRAIPNLIVIDKRNGGKADALNMGINVAKNTYVCGIDADSLLEENALLKLASVTLDESIEHIALGGNIVPVNGCTVDKGKIEHHGLGKEAVVRYQTVEYLRAFTTGRIGWSKLRTLLIISGAFGLFSRRAILEMGGYLTISGELKKDTVGEDMELVVRLTYRALKYMRPYRVKFVHNANCYTELPAELGGLLRQRNRWHRGLIDILSYHREILFNPFYKQVGLVGFPYFFIFEMLGPFFELIGYLALITGGILGILNSGLVILLLFATIGYGIIVSLVAIWITERHEEFFSEEETGKLILVAIAENFGYRQLLSIHRIMGTFSALRESGQWGSQNRKGFAPQQKK